MNRPLTRPFDFVRLLKPVAARWFFVAWLNVALVFGLLALTGSRLVFAPALAVELPSTGEAELVNLDGALVATLKADGVLYFSGRKQGLLQFEQALRSEVGGRGGVVLLLRVDGGASVDMLVETGSAARRAGVSRVQLAANRKPGEGSGIKEVR